MPKLHVYKKEYHTKYNIPIFHAICGASGKHMTAVSEFDFLTVNYKSLQCMRCRKILEREGKY